MERTRKEDGIKDELETRAERKQQRRGLGKETVVAFLMKESDTQLIASSSTLGTLKILKWLRFLTSAGLSVQGHKN